MHKDQDIEYLIRLKSGDQEGLRFFMRLWGEQLRFYSFKITRNKEVSEEIVSEAFCIAWQNKEKTVSVAALKSYLFLVVRNASYDHTSGYYRKNVDLGDEFLLETPERKTRYSLTDYLCRNIGTNYKRTGTFTETASRNFSDDLSGRKK
ncbi:RNA polymerase sigma factor [Sphingobacterium thermophilum]|uniref:RNA polymerase sigma-70 region 2 domain-containing protein n=1 Tax=Sphingobacterium thermophilum TaxID=768534 RepID=A0ABP8R3S6_9SPHI